MRRRRNRSLKTGSSPERALRQPKHQLKLQSKRSKKPIFERTGSLRNGEKELGSIFAASPDAITVTDLNGKIIECNQATLDLHEFTSKQELIGKSAFQLIARKDHPRALRNMKKALKQKTLRNLEYTFVTRRGRKFPAELSASVVRDAKGKPVAFVAVTEDITERKRAEEALIESEKRYRSVVDNIGIGVATISPRMEILTLNRQMKKWFPSINVSEKPICYKVYNDPPRKTICPYCPTCKTLKDGRVHESTTETPRGDKVRNFWVVSSPLKNREGKTIAAIEMVEDVTDRKRTEEELKEYSQHLEKLVAEKTANLQESEEHFRSVADYASEAIVTIDAHGIIVFWNKAAQIIFGYSFEEALGKPVTMMMPKRSKKNQQEGIRQLISAGKSNLAGRTLEFLGLRKDGSEFPLELSFSVWKTRKMTFFTGIMRDITERKKAQEALRESEKRYRNLVETAPDAIYTLSEDGTIASLNPTFERITGWRRSEWLGKSFAAIVHPDDLPLAIETFQKTLRGKTPKPYELRILSKSGEYLVGEFTSKPHVENGKIVGEFGIVRDITERKKTEQALQSSEAKFRTLFENVPDGVYQSTPAGKIITANPALVHMLGYDSLDELLALNVSRDLYVRPEDRKTWQKKMEENDDLRNAELVLKRKDGQQLIALENSHAVRDKHDGILYYEGTLTNITERKMLEERLSALNFFSGKLNTAHNLQQTYELALDAMEKMLGFENAAFMVVERNHLKVGSQRGYHEPLLELPLNGSKKGITVRAANACKPVLVPDVKKDKDYVVGAPHVRSEVAVPVMIEDRVLGVLDVESSELNSFNEQDLMLLQVLASHTATAISNLQKREEIERRSGQLASLMRSSAEIIRPMDLRKRLEMTAEAITKLGWRRVVMRAIRDGNMELSTKKDLVTAGLTKEERAFLWNNRMPGQVWRERFGPEYERFKIGEFYHLPWNDPWVRKKFSEGTVPSKLTQEEMIDWDPQDLLYAPLQLADGRIVGVLSIDDPIDGKRPTKESIAPLELFIRQAAVAIENAQLIEQLNYAKDQIKEYADQLELKVKQRTRELVEAQNKLLKTERLAAIGEVAAMVGHDLRNPLTGIAGATYFLRLKLGSRVDEKSKAMLEVIEKDVDYSNKIVNDLLDYSREMHLELKWTSPKSIVQEALSLVKIPSNAQLRDLTKDEPKVEVDAEKMKRVFVNLIKNALDAMPKGGTLTIESRKVDNQLEIVFIDTGTGMTKEVLQKLWSPLFTTKARGMGFGLPICKRVVEAHGGSISARSKIGEGAIFTVTIPIKPQIEGGGNVWVNVPESLLSMMMKA